MFDAKIEINSHIGEILLETWVYLNIVTEPLNGNGICSSLYIWGRFYKQYEWQHLTSCSARIILPVGHQVL
ncbi:MAG: hypothetical protein HY738_24265 [Bacteroidia bacterium]|nr:hypothetical protein [Bacteroidia bacterium]